MSGNDVVNIACVYDIIALCEPILQTSFCSTNLK